jgi:hypothetical protein
MKNPKTKPDPADEAKLIAAGWKCIDPPCRTMWCWIEPTTHAAYTYKDALSLVAAQKRNKKIGEK